MLQADVEGHEAALDVAHAEYQKLAERNAMVSKRTQGRAVRPFLAVFPLHYNRDVARAEYQKLAERNAMVSKRTQGRTVRPFLAVFPWYFNSGPITDYTR